MPTKEELIRAAIERHNVCFAAYQGALAANERAQKAAKDASEACERARRCRDFTMAEQNRLEAEQAAKEAEAASKEAEAVAPEEDPQLSIESVAVPDTERPVQASIFDSLDVGPSVKAAWPGNTIKEVLPIASEPAAQESGPSVDSPTRHKDESAPE